MRKAHQLLLAAYENHAPEFFLPEEKPAEQRDLLVITPDLSLNGANTALLELLPLLRERDFCPLILAQEDGVMKNQFLRAGGSVMVQPALIPTQPVREAFRTAFDTVFLNSSNVHPYSLFFQNTQVPVVWWFHESREQLETTQRDLPHLALLSENFTLTCVSEKVRRGLRELYGCEAAFLPTPVRDVCGERAAPVPAHPEDDTVCFFVPAAYTRIKGQDILLKALALMPEAYARRTRVILAGYLLPEQQAYYRQLRSIAEKLTHVTMLDEIPRESVYEYYRQCDCVIAPSRIDSLPFSAIEAMMFGRLCIVSDGAGLSDYISDCRNGFVFPKEDAGELMKRMVLVVADKGQMGDIAAAGRNLYLQTFSPEAAGEQMDRLMTVVS